MADTKVTPPVDPEVELAELIRRVSEGMNSLLRSGLNREAIVVLLRDHTGISKRDIGNVLDGLKTLASRYTTKKA